MNISFRTTTAYFAVCQICGTRGPVTGSKAHAMAGAHKEGWVCIKGQDGMERVSTTLCPTCSRIYEAMHWAKGKEPTE